MDPKVRKLVTKIVGVIGLMAILLGMLLPALSFVTFQSSVKKIENTSEAQETELPATESPNSTPQE